MSIKTLVELIGKKAINHDCYIFTFKYIQQTITFKIGQHFRIYQNVKTVQVPEGEDVIRKYTPISPCSQKETMDVLIKIYRPNVHPMFPNGGKLTPFLQKMDIGQKLQIQGPFGRFGYEPHGIVSIDGQKKQYKRIFFMAGGSGITPIFQSIWQIAKMQGEDIELILLFANKEQKDIVLQKQLEELQPRLKTHYILDTPPADWKGYKGYVTRELLQEICPLDDPDTLYIHCGPFPMNKLIRDLFTTQFPKSTLFKF